MLNKSQFNIMQKVEEKRNAKEIGATKAVHRNLQERTKLGNPDATNLLKLRMNETLQKFVDVILSIFVRLVYIVEATFFIYITATLKKSGFIYFIMICIVVIIFDGLFVVFKRLGKEYTW